MSKLKLLKKVGSIDKGSTKEVAPRLEKRWIVELFG
jgi:hypothetical protein